MATEDGGEQVEDCEDSEAVRKRKRKGEGRVGRKKKTKTNQPEVDGKVDD